MNTPVKFEIAKLLKEKGFDNESAHYYNEKGEMLFDAYYPSLQPTKPDVYYDNPTIAEVVMWLYEGHGVWITSYPIGVGYYCYQIYSIKNRKNSKDNIVQNEKDSIQYDELFNSPTEAYEAAIFYVLSNLI